MSYTSLKWTKWILSAAGPILCLVSCAACNKSRKLILEEGAACSRRDNQNIQDDYKNNKRSSVRCCWRVVCVVCSLTVHFLHRQLYEENRTRGCFWLRTLHIPKEHWDIWESQNMLSLYYYVCHYYYRLVCHFHASLHLLCIEIGNVWDA